MKKNPPADWATIEDGSLILAGKLCRIPGFRIAKKVGQGANAVVFEAMDETLNRQVAVKVWNVRGARRALPETKKIAQLSHPLIVATHQFGKVNDQPYSVMEFVAGESGKSWLKQNPSISDRALFWRLYSKALRFIHDSGEIHGDPHLGNALILPDGGGIYGRDPGFPYGEHPFSIKLADTGTSQFWTFRSAILEREGTLIFETASRLFEDQNLRELWFQPHGLSHQHALQVLDSLCQYVYDVNCMVDEDRKSGNADTLVDLLFKVPLFELDEVVLQIRRTGYTTTNRLASRLNKRLFEIYDLEDASDEITPETRSSYAAMRRTFLEDLAQKQR